MSITEREHGILKETLQLSEQVRDLTLKCSRLIEERDRYRELLRLARPYLDAAHAMAAQVDDMRYDDASGEMLDRIRGLCQQIDIALGGKRDA